MIPRQKGSYEMMFSGGMGQMVLRFHATPCMRWMLPRPDVGINLFTHIQLFPRFLNELDSRFSACAAFLIPPGRRPGLQFNPAV